MSDAIRIVPLKPPESAEQIAPSASLALTYRGGPLLASVEIFTAFWGSAWSQQPLSDVMQTMNKFFDDVVSSVLMDQLAEYSVSGKMISHGTHAGTVVVGAPPPRDVDDSAIQQLVRDQIAANVFVKTGSNTLYFVMLPPGTAVVQRGSRSCQAFCGYHDTFGAGIYYGVLPYPDCAGCSGTLSIIDALTVTASHELAESITDPVPGTGWYDDANGEIGDICAWQTKKMGAYTIQLEWSNHAGKCL